MNLNDKDTQDLLTAIAAVEAQRATLGDTVLELATAPLRARLAGLLRPAGLQRRQVTVVFADVVGSTALAQGMDAEETLAILSGALLRMADWRSIASSRRVQRRGSDLPTWRRSPGCAVPWSCCASPSHGVGSSCCRAWRRWPTLGLPADAGRRGRCAGRADARRFVRGHPDLRCLTGRRCRVH